MKPKITVIVEGGVVQEVLIENGAADVFVRDYDCEGDGGELVRDDHGDPYNESHYT